MKKIALVLTLVGLTQFVFGQSYFNKNYSLNLLNGNSILIDSYRGNIIVVNFWKTSCVPCVKEIPQLNKLVKKYANDSVVFLAISPEEDSNINSFLKKHEFNFIQIVKGKEFIDLSENNFMSGYPTSFILNKNGKLVFKQKWSSDKIDKILSEQIEKIKNN